MSGVSGVFGVSSSLLVCLFLFPSSSLLVCFFLSPPLTLVCFSPPLTLVFSPLSLVCFSHPSLPLCVFFPSSPCVFLLSLLPLCVFFCVFPPPLCFSLSLLCVFSHLGVWGVRGVPGCSAVCGVSWVSGVSCGSRRWICGGLFATYYECSSITRERGNDYRKWAICADGGTRVVDGETLAGWGVVSRSPHGRIYVMFRLVVTTEAHLAFSGARTHSNNTAEMTAMIGALFFLGPHGPVTRDEQSCIYHDSLHAAGICLGTIQARTHVQLALACQQSMICAQHAMQHVYGHGGNLGNECADHAAALGTFWPYPEP